MARAYTDGLFPDEAYDRQKRLLELELESLVVPEANAAEKAGKLFLDLPKLWAEANPDEQRKLLLTMLDTVLMLKRLSLLWQLNRSHPLDPSSRWQQRKNFQLSK